MRPEHGVAACEVTQTVYDKSQAVAQTALGRPGRGEAMRLTILVPPNLTLSTPPRLVGADNEPAVELSWRRCVPAGCLADAILTEEQVKRLRARTENGRVTFQDGAGREAAIPFAPRGLAPALDALAKEDAR
jgi:invasion protein IalB